MTLEDFLVGLPNWYDMDIEFWKDAQKLFPEHETTEEQIKAITPTITLMHFYHSLVWVLADAAPVEWQQEDINDTRFILRIVDKISKECLFSLNNLESKCLEKFNAKL